MHLHLHIILPNKYKWNDDGDQFIMKYVLYCSNEWNNFFIGNQIYHKQAFVLYQDDNNKTNKFDINTWVKRSKSIFWKEEIYLFNFWSVFIFI